MQKLEEIKAEKTKSSESHLDEALLKEAEEHTITQESIMLQEQQEQQQQQQLLYLQQYQQYQQQNGFNQYNGVLPYPLPQYTQQQQQQPIQRRTVQTDPLLDAYNGITSDTPSSTDYCITIFLYYILFYYYYYY